MSNTIRLSGRVGKDAELRTSQSGMAIATFSIADSSGKDDKKKTQWVNIVAFGKTAEMCGSVTKGAFLEITGMMQLDEYEKDGQKHRTTKVIANSISKPLWSLVPRSAEDVPTDVPTDVPMEDDLPF
jgi:single-strand DNA-binding protein